MKTRTSLNVSSDFRQVSLRFIFQSGRRLPNFHANEIACRLQIHIEHYIFTILRKLAAPFTYAYFSKQIGVSHLTGEKLTTTSLSSLQSRIHHSSHYFTWRFLHFLFLIILLLILNSLFEKAYSFPNLSILSSTPLSLF